jgi:hypothetical protein
MRACFLGQNICALGFGVATLQTPPLVVDEAGDPQAAPAKATPAQAVPTWDEHVSRKGETTVPWATPAVGTPL